MTNKSDLIREFIRTLFDSNHDFSNRELNKTKFKEYFEVEDKKTLDISWQKHQTLFLDQMKIVAREKGIDVRTFGYGGTKEKFKNLSQTGIKSTISPKPKAGGIMQPQQAQGLQAATSGGLVATEGAQTATAQVITPLTDEEAAKLTTILCRSFGGAVHRFKPDFKEFTDAEAEELGVAWMPLAKPYLEKYGGKIFTALVVTAGIITKDDRLAAFKPKQKGDTTREEKEKKQELPKGETQAANSEFEQYQKRMQK